MKEREIYLPLLKDEVSEKEIALNAATESCVIFREYLEEEFGIRTLDALWAFTIFMRLYPDFIENNPHLLEDVKAVLNRKNSSQQKIRSSKNN